MDAYFNCICLRIYTIFKLVGKFTTFAFSYICGEKSSFWLWSLGVRFYLILLPKKDWYSNFGYSESLFITWAAKYIKYVYYKFSGITRKKIVPENRFVSQYIFIFEEKTLTGVLWHHYFSVLRVTFGYFEPVAKLANKTKKGQQRLYYYFNELL